MPLTKDHPFKVGEQYRVNRRSPNNAPIQKGAIVTIHGTEDFLEVWHKADWWVIDPKFLDLIEPEPTTILINLYPSI